MGAELFNKQNLLHCQIKRLEIGIRHEILVHLIPHSSKSITPEKQKGIYTPALYIVDILWNIAPMKWTIQSTLLEAIQELHTAED